jgi:hypothetical protein
MADRSNTTRVLTDSRGTSPVVGKAMEATLVVLYLGLVTTTLYGGAVPAYRATAGAEVADRTLANAATDVESAVPPDARAVTVRLDLDLPGTIAGHGYRIRPDGEALVLEHPDATVATRTPLVLPDRVIAVTGEWQGGDDTVIRVETVGNGLEVRLA